MPKFRRTPGPAWSAFQRNLRLGLAARGLTPETVNDRFDRSEKWADRLLSGVTAPHVDDLVPLAELLDVTVDTLLTSTPAEMAAALGVPADRGLLAS